MNIRSYVCTYVYLCKYVCIATSAEFIHMQCDIAKLCHDIYVLCHAEHFGTENNINLHKCCKIRYSYVLTLTVEHIEILIS